MSTALYVLRISQVGLSINELDFFNLGDVIDIFTEAANDQTTYRQVASQADFDKF